MEVIFGIISIILALTCYSVGVWNQIILRQLKLKHVILFWIGLIFDITGTALMYMVAGSFKINLHGVTGIVALILMSLNAIWATIILLRKNKRLKSNFHKVSLTVWIIWLIPLFTGMFLNIK